MDLHLYHFRDEFAQDITSPNGLTSAIKRNKELHRRRPRACTSPS